MRRIGPVRTTLLSVVWGAARVRHRRPQARSPSRRGRGPARSPERVGADRRHRFRRRRRGSRDGCEQRQDAPTDRLARPGRRSIDCRGATRHRCTSRGAGSRSCGRRSRQCAQACPDRFGRWRAAPDADPSRCSAGYGARRDTLRAGPSGPPTTDGAGIDPGSHPDRRPKPGRTAHAPLRADAGGGRPSARCGRRRRAERGRRRAHPPGGRRAHRGRRAAAASGRRRVDPRARRPPRRQRRRPPLLPRRVAARRSEPRSCLCSSPRRSPRCRRRRGHRSSSPPRRSSDARISAISRRKPFR